MALTLQRERIKEKCGIADTAYDATIDNLIIEQQPVIEATIDPIALADPDRLPTLNLAATEIVCAEFMLQLAREPGATEGVNLNGLEVFSRKVVLDAEAMRASALVRLGPYLLVKPKVGSTCGKDATE